MLECSSRWMMMVNDQTYQRIQKYLRIWIRYQTIAAAQREETYCPSRGYLEPKWFLELKGFSSQLFLCRKHLTPSSSIFNSLTFIQRK
ncbi:hypothetical protein Bca101_066752 [Brassica carinata]